MNVDDLISKTTRTSSRILTIYSVTLLTAFWTETELHTLPVLSQFATHHVSRLEVVVILFLIGLMVVHLVYWTTDLHSPRLLYSEKAKGDLLQVEGIDMDGEDQIDKLLKTKKEGRRASWRWSSHVSEVTSDIQNIPTDEFFWKLIVIFRRGQHEVSGNLVQYLPHLIVPLGMSSTALIWFWFGR